MESRCGILCSACTYREKTGCTGCRNQQPFWGACPVQGCCEARGHDHCGVCGDFVCKLLHSFAYDAEHGDGTGARLETCRRWAKGG